MCSMKECACPGTCTSAVVLAELLTGRLEVWLGCAEQSDLLVIQQQPRLVILCFGVV